MTKREYLINELMRMKLMYKHLQLVQAGKFAVARGIFKLLNTGSIILYFDDTSNEIENILEKLNVKRSINRRGIATYRI